MNSAITKKQMIDDIWKILEESVKDFPKNEKEEAKAKILETWSKSMFYSGGSTKGKTT